MASNEEKNLAYLYEHEEEILGDIYSNFAKLGVELPHMPIPGGNYSLAVQSGSLVFTSGQTPKENGVLLKKGKLGKDVTEEEGYLLAQRCTLNALAAVEALIGNLNLVTRVVKATVFVNSAPDYFGQAKVANGCTDLLVGLYGDPGRPARSAVGMAVLPGDAPCEVELILEVKPAE